MQLKDLENQLMSIQWEDTFILGDFNVPLNSTLIVPQDEVGTVQGWKWVKDKLITVLPRNTHPLKFQIMGFIKDKQGWIFMENAKKEVLALKGGDNFLVNKLFFSKLLQQYPYISYLPHKHHFLGFLDKNSHYLLFPMLGQQKKMVPGGEDLKELFSKMQDKSLKDENIPINLRSALGSVDI